MTTTSLLDKGLARLNEFLTHTTAIHAPVAAQTFEAAAREIADYNQNTQPVFTSPGEAIAYLQAEKHRPGSSQRKHPAHPAPHKPYSRHIAMMRKPDGSVWVLHATKGWKKGIH